MTKGKTPRIPTVKDVEMLKAAAQSPCADDIIPAASKVIEQLIPDCYSGTALSLPDVVLTEPAVDKGTIFMFDEAHMEDVDCRSLGEQFRRDLATNLWNEIMDYIRIDETL